MKIGFIFECGPNGADVHVSKYLVKKLDPDIEFIPITLDNKKKLIEGCGKNANLLLESGCVKIIIVWDLYPPWRDEKPCRHQDRESILDCLKAENIDLNRVSLVCICEELEAWLLADHRAVQDMIADLKYPHPVGKVPKFKKPDSISKPKIRLTKIFNQEIGKHRRYIDYQDAIKVAQNITDFNKIKNSESFRRFALKVTGISL